MIIRTRWAEVSSEYMARRRSLMSWNLLEVRRVNYFFNKKCPYTGIRARD